MTPHLSGVDRGSVPEPARDQPHERPPRMDLADRSTMDVPLIEPGPRDLVGLDLAVVCLEFGVRRATDPDVHHVGVADLGPLRTVVLVTRHEVAMPVGDARILAGHQHVDLAVDQVFVLIVLQVWDDRVDDWIQLGHQVSCLVQG